MQPDRDAYLDALRRICPALRAARPELDGLDGEIGDGDLGATLETVSAALSGRLDVFPETLPACLRETAEVIASVSGSSFSAISMFGLLAAGKWLDAEPGASLPALLDAAVGEMSARGGASLGDKTVLDALDAVSTAMAKAETPTAALARAACAETVEAFRARPSRIGRARLASERKSGLADPGMVALLRALEALAAPIDVRFEEAPA